MTSAPIRDALADQAGGQPISWVSLACELQRDWARQDTVQAIVEIVLTDRLLKDQEK
jgi:nicotinamidase-related amidase